MYQVMSIEGIKQHARNAAAALDEIGLHPTNPCEPGTDAHREWAAEFYRVSLKIAEPEAA